MSPTAVDRRIRGPYEDEGQAAADVEDVYRSSSGPDDFRSAREIVAINRGELFTTLLDAGVKLGGYDLRLVEKLGELQPEIVAGLCGWIDRANRTTESRGN